MFAVNSEEQKIRRLWTVDDLLLDVIILSSIAVSTEFTTSS